MENPVRSAANALDRLHKWLLQQPFFTSTLLPALPRSVRWTLRRAYFLPLDLADRVLGDRDVMRPPKSAVFCGLGNFERGGRVLVQRLVAMGGLTPDSHVLDIGCGIGRLALAMTRYLGAAGSYTGLDIVPSGIEWCNRHIASSHPNFTFTLADVSNTEYHPKGRLRPEQYRFPYPDESFDLVVLVSVFTHMMPGGMDHYLSEISRVLKPGGRCFATYFLINAESKRLMDAGGGSIRFTHGLGSHWVVDKAVPELSVAYDDAYAREAHERHGLSVNENVSYGGWCGRAPAWATESGPGDQDVIVSTKTETGHERAPNLRSAPRALPH